MHVSMNNQIVLFEPENKLIGKICTEVRNTRNDIELIS